MGRAGAGGAALSRRQFVVSLAAAAGAGRRAGASALTGFAQASGSARLTFTPRDPDDQAAPGLVPLGVAAPRDAWLQVPPGYDPARRWPLLVALHGATQSHEFMLGVLGEAARARGVLLLAPNSAAYTWDGILGHFGPDVALLDRALVAAQRVAAVDQRRVLLCGFSDGASYALGIGRANGDLFGRVAALSPGFIARSDSPDRGRPRIFVSHGRQDRILPIDRSGRRVVEQLRAEGFGVRFEEFDGPHGVPPRIAQLAIDWLL